MKDFIKKTYPAIVCRCADDRTPIRMAPLPHHSRNRCTPTFGRKNDVYLLHAPTSETGSPRKMPHLWDDSYPCQR